MNLSIVFMPKGDYNQEVKSMESTLTSLDKKYVEKPTDIAGGKGRYGKSESDKSFMAQSVVKTADGVI